MSTDIVSSLAARSRAEAKKIVVIGDAMTDVWIRGRLVPNQDGCVGFMESHRTVTPGGAANAARQLCYWQDRKVTLLALSGTLAYNAEVSRDNCSCDGFLPVKHRWINEAGRIVFRQDREYPLYGLDEELLAKHRKQLLRTLYETGPDGILISDYDKGTLDHTLLSEVIEWANKEAVPIVADAKRRPSYYAGALIKCNSAYRERYYPMGAHLVTHGQDPPELWTGAQPLWATAPRPPVVCRNHVGAGDCFAAHLLLGLVYGLELKAAATLADAAARVYVQHEQGRPPRPYEVGKDLDPVGGKILDARFLPMLRHSSQGRLVFTNGVFRLPHAGHAWLLDWAKKQGGVLVVGVNDDESAGTIRPGQFVRPLPERLQWLACQQAVDWVIPFTEPNACATIESLRPDLVVKGSEFRGQEFPEAAVTRAVAIAPESPYTDHATDLVGAIRTHGSS